MKLDRKWRITVALLVMAYTLLAVESILLFELANR
jgi:hypothetical protein